VNDKKFVNNMKTAESLTKSRYFHSCHTRILR